MIFLDKIDLVGDWEKIVCDYLKNNNHTIPKYTDKLELGVSFSNLKYMTIDNIPRKVFISKEFNCPPKFKKRISSLKKNIEKGISLNPFLSKGSSRITNKDYLLYDWNIYHLHLGKYDLNKDKYSSRTNELLFVYITEKAAYFLDILDHNSFTEKKLLSIIKLNWPFLLEKFILHGFTATTQNLSGKEIGLLRKKGVSTLIQLDSGEILFPPGKGIVSTSDSFRAVDSTLKLLKTLRDYELFFLKNSMQIKKDIFKYKKVNLKILYMELKIYRGTFHVIEKQSGYIISLFSHEDYSLIT